MINELVICGASLPDGICQGALPPEEWRQAVNEVFAGEQPDGGYRVLPAIEMEGTDDELDNREDGTYRELPIPLHLGQYTVPGAILCTGCYVTLCVLSPSGAGLTHELAAALKKAREMAPADLPRIG